MHRRDWRTQLVRLTTRAVIVTSAAIVIFGLWRAIAMPNTGAADIRPGDTLRLEGIDFAAAKHSVVVFVNSNCRYCTESMPFYRRLTGLGKARVIVIGYQQVDVLQAYVNSHGLFPDALLSVTPAMLPVSGTPTVMIVDAAQRVIAVWKGLLRARESEVEASLS